MGQGLSRREKSGGHGIWVVIKVMREDGGHWEREGRRRDPQTSPRKDNA